MRVLLDECPPRRLRHEFVGHEVRTVPEMGWAMSAKSNRLGDLRPLVPQVLKVLERLTPSDAIRIGA